MKEVWYMTIVLLMLGILSGFVGMSNPTSAIVINIPPHWDFPTDEFFSDDEIVLDLNSAFFDGDGDSLAFNVSPGYGVSAGVMDDVLVVDKDSNGQIVITVSDGTNVVSKTIYVRN